MADLNLFWSYSHLDDASDRGRVVTLAKHLAEEVQVLSGLELDLFVDRDSLAWGDEWKTRIDAALSSSTFLVSVLTPTYFRRPECRREFVAFYSQAESRGLHKLLLPLAYVDVPDFDGDNPDEVIAIASRYQHESWTSLRLKDPDSEEYRLGVNRLALKLLELHRTMAATEREKLEVVEANPDAQEVGFLEALSEIEKRLPTWTEAVERHAVQRAQSLAIDETYENRMAKAPAGRRLAIRHNYASDELKLVLPSLDLGRLYSSLTIDMAPFVTSAVRGAAGSPEAKASLRPLADAVRDAHENIQLFIDGVAPTDYWEPWAALGGVFTELLSAHNEFRAFSTEANELVEEWHSQLTALLNDTESEVPHATA